MKTLLSAASFCLLASVAWAEGVTHKIAFHVDENDPQVMNMALNNVQNVAAYYAEQGDSVVIEVVAYGPGLQMYVAETSPVKARISTLALEMDNISFAACGNTLSKMSEKAGHEVALVEEATVVPSGVVRLVELQEEGFSYIRP